MANGNWLKLNRCILQSSVFDNPNVLKVWIWCLCKATHTDHEQLVGLQIVKLKPGQFVFGRHVAAEQLNLKETSVYKYMKLLESLGNISINSNNKFSVVTVENWEKFQCDDDDEEQQSDNKGTTKEQQSDTNKNGKKGKKGKNNIIRHKHGTYDNVLLSDEDFTKLLEEFPMDYKDRIERLSEYMKSTGKSYKDHLATIRNWARRETKPKRRNEVLDILESGVLDD